MLNTIKRWRKRPGLDSKADAVTRKVQSEQWLDDAGVTVNKTLPCLPGVHQCTLQSAHAIWQRIYALFYLSAKAEDQDPAALSMLQKRCLSPLQFTHNEQKLLAQDNWTLADKESCVWRYEAINTLLWTLKLHVRLSKPNQVCDILGISRLVLNSSAEELTARTKIRTPAQCLDQADLYYRYSQSMTSKTGSIYLADINEQVVQQRFHCFMWLMGLIEWDDAFPSALQQLSKQERLQVAP
ncbi:DUF4272 domain-containing protein [Motilimonas pumila]|nr:DUF4272 domain-containing protein [Motilimonas pumila]